MRRKKLTPTDLVKCIRKDLIDLENVLFELDENNAERAQSIKETRHEVACKKEILILLTKLDPNTEL